MRRSADEPGLSWGTTLRIGATVYAGTARQTGVLIAHHAALVAPDRRSGALRWTTPLDEPKGASVFGCVSSLAESNGMVVACTVDGTLAVYPLR